MVKVNKRDVFVGGHVNFGFLVAFSDVRYEETGREGTGLAMKLNMD